MKSESDTASDATTEPEPESDTDTDAFERRERSGPCEPSAPHGSYQWDEAGEPPELRRVLHAVTYTSNGRPPDRAAGRRREQPVTVDRFNSPHTRARVLRDLADGLRESVDTLNQNPLPAGPADLERRLEYDAALARRGIRVRALYPRAPLREARGARFLQELSDAGVIVRVIDHVAHDMLIFDRHTVCLPDCCTDGLPGRSMIRIRGSVLVRSFTAVYESYWQRATPLPLAGAELRHTALGERERAVIRLMASGYGDDRIARKLGIEPSEVEDVMSALMERLGAGSRFEVGYKLARALDPRDL
jgi:DNA-binding CsgD family transcriptional regulator